MQVNDIYITVFFSVEAVRKTQKSRFWKLNPRPAGVWLVTRPAGGGAKGPPP